MALQINVKKNDHVKTMFVSDHLIPMEKSLYPGGSSSRMTMTPFIGHKIVIERFDAWEDDMNHVLWPLSPDLNTYVRLGQSMLPTTSSKHQIVFQRLKNFSVYREFVPRLNHTEQILNNKSPVTIRI